MPGHVEQEKNHILQQFHILMDSCDMDMYRGLDNTPRVYGTVK